MIRLITWYDDNMSRSAELCVRSAEKHGVEKAESQIKSFNTFDSFQYFNEEILDAKRGAGYWLFKPYVIMEAICIADEGDVIIYADAGIEFVESVRHIIDRMDQDIFFFTNGFPHVEWCKGDVYNAILGPLFSNHAHTDRDRTESGFRKQVQASVIFFKVNEATRNFVKEWLLWCQMPGFIDDSPSKLPNYPTFAEHRHDQAILTCLQIKYGYKVHFWPTAYSEHIRHTALPEDNYPTMFNHHRLRDKGKGNGQPEWPQS
jgi:hypothetical protein